MSREPRTLELPADEYCIARSMADFVAEHRDLDFSQILASIDSHWPDARFKTVYAALAIAVSEGVLIANSSQESGSSSRASKAH